MAKIKCWRCGYQWDSRKKQPKECPRCKARLDNPRKEKEEF